ncbi:MAG: ribonuclease HI [Flavobacteriales bacterium]|nr:ribonuclease HI [Flavobacteriales bacterium]
MAKPVIHIYTDGAARGNPGPGGFGIVLKAGPHRKEYAEGYRHTTNNRMELKAVITGLEMLKTRNVPVVIYSDSKYVVDAIDKGWVFDWAKKRFKGKKNPDLWLAFLKLYSQFQIKMVWVKGHADNPENNRCDELAVAASLGKKQLVDTYYESQQKDDLFS